MDLPPPRSWQRPTDLPAPGTYAVAPAEPEKKKGGGSGWLIGVMLLSLAAVIAIVLITRNGSDTDSTETTTPPPTVTETVDPTEVETSAAETTAVEETAAPTTEAPAATTVAEPTTTAAAETTAPPATTIPAPATGLPADLEVIVASADGTHVVTAAGDTVLVPRTSSRSFRAFDGSIIFQQTSGQFGGGSSDSTHIQRIAPGGDAVIVAADTGEFLQLHDVDEGDGNDIVVLYSVSTGTTPEDSEEGLYRLDLLSGSTTYLGVIGGWEYGTAPLHLGGDIVVGEASAEVSTSLLALDLRGNPVNLAASLGLAEAYSDCSECPHSFAIDAEGLLVAWVENSTLVVAERSGAIPALRYEIPGLVPTPGIDLHVQAGVIIINREGLAPLIVDVRSGSPMIGELAVIGSATFA